MPRRGNCCRCIGCTSNFIFRDRQHPLTSVFSQTGASRSPLPDPDERGLPTRWFIPRAWLEYVVGTTRQPRGGSLLVDLQATGISVGATVIPLLDRPTSEVVRDSNGIRYHQGVSLTQSELTQPMAVSLFGDGVQTGSALRLTATGQTSPLYFADNTNVVMLRCIPIGHSLNSTTTTTYPHPTEVEACVDAATAGLLAYLEFVIEQRRNLVPGYTDAMVEEVQAQYAAARVAAEPTCSQPTVTVTYGEGYSIVPGGSIMNQDSWELATYDNILPFNHVPFSDILSRRVAYANYVRSARAARDTTELSPRLGISLGAVSRLVQPESGRFGSGNNSIEILTASPEEGVIVATARPQGAPDNPFGWGDPSPPSLIWPEPLLKPLFSRNPLSGLSGSAYRSAIYRDGEPVATVDRTPPAAPSNWTGPFAEHTNEDGSYLLQFDSNAGLLQGFLSFVIDRTPPMGCFEQVNDFFVGDPTSASGIAYDGDTGLVRRFETEDSGFKSYSNTRSEFSKSLEAGTYTLEYPGQYFDHVGNPMPTPLPTAQFQVHAVPAQQRCGAQATLTLPGSDDTPVYDAPVPSIAVAFNRQVAGLRKSMFAITGRKDDGTTVDLSFTLSGDDGEIAGNATGGGTTFTLSLDIDEQDYNTSWLAVFSPQAGGSLVAVAGEQTPEPCVLRSRCSWLVGQDPAFGRTPIDTGSSAVVLNRVPTLTATIQEDSLPDAPERYDSLIDLSADTILPVNYVNDAALPIGCYEQVSDFFTGDPTNASGVAYGEGGIGEVRRVASERTYPSWEGVSTFSRLLSPSANPYRLENLGTFVDLAGNAMPEPPTAQFRVHQIPENGKLGAHAWIAIDSDTPANKSPILRGPVEFLRISFSRPIEGLNLSMISVAGTLANGTAATLAFRLFAGGDRFAPEIIGNEPGSGSVFTVWFESPQPQAAGSSWLVTLTPDSGLVVPASGGALAEPCVLVARRSWLVAQDESPYSVPSQTATYVYGQSSPFVPQVPPALDEATDVPYSYFGLSTTVYPSAPKALPCPAPGASQPQSSLIVGNSNVTSLNVQIAGAYQVTQPLTFSAALNSEQCSQNVWAHSSTGGGPSGSEHSTTSRTQSLSTQANTVFVYTPRDGSGGIVFGRSSGGTAFSPPAISQGDVRAQASASGSSWVFGSATATALASRTAATYPAFQTSTLGQLSLKMNLSVTVKTTTYSGLVGATPVTWRATRARQSWEIQELNSNYPQSGNTIPALNSPIRPLWDAYAALPVNSAERLAAFNQYNAAREAGREDFYHVDNMDRQWPPEPEEWGGYQWGEDPPANAEVPSGSPNSIGIEGPIPVGSGDQFFGYYLATYYVTDKNGNWVPITSYGGNPAGSFGAAITVEGPKAAGAGVYYEDAGYSVSNGLGHTPYEDANGDIQAGFFTASPNKASPMQPAGRSLALSNTLTLTRLQEEHLAAGQPVQVQVGSLVYTITAS